MCWSDVVFLKVTTTIGVTGTSTRIEVTLIFHSLSSTTYTDATLSTMPQLPLPLTSYTLEWSEGNMMSSARAMFTKWNCQTVCYTPSDSQFWINWIVYPSFVSYPNVSKNLDAGVKHKYLFIEIKRGRPAIAWRWRCEWCKYIYKYIYIYIYIYL